MNERSNNSEIAPFESTVNPAYASTQLAKALTTSEQHQDPETRHRAQDRVAKWECVLLNVLNGTVAYGSRTPVTGVPLWATLEVVTGGFATGQLLAGGKLLPHELELLKSLPPLQSGGERLALNAHFLTDAGLRDLQQLLQSGCYDINVPEEGALLVVAWLVQNDHVDQARTLLDTISSQFAELRFYPIPIAQPMQFGARVHLRDVRQTMADLERIEPNRRVLAQKEAVEVWAPFLDRVVAIFLETVADGWPCQTYPDGWAKRASALLMEFSQLRTKHSLCGKPARLGGHFAQLLDLLSKCVQAPRSLTGRQVGRLRMILNRYAEKHGRPNSPECIAQRKRQQAEVSGPLFSDVSRIVLSRLQKHAASEGLDDISPLNVQVAPDEAVPAKVPAGFAIPESIQRKVERCLNETVTVLVDRGLITSGETLARVLPQMTSGIRSAGISDPVLRRLYSAIYRAFRRRRSLLLLNLEKQVQIEELPWVNAIDRFRTESLTSQELARQTLEEVSLLAVTSFPHAILPNKLLQELRALAKTANLSISLVDEVAADIFMGQFSDKFVESAKRAGDFLKGTLYSAYYGIDYEPIQGIPSPEKSKGNWFQRTEPQMNRFAELCAARAGVPLNTWEPATNGMIIEQQQILTTQNLAALFAGLNLTEAIHGQLGDLAFRCFQWVCQRLQVKTDNWHARLIAVKNSAYAWRQMVFYLALLPKEDVRAFLGSANEYLVNQSVDFASRFQPAVDGLRMAVNGESLVMPASRNAPTQFLGWSKERHWLLSNH